MSTDPREIEWFIDANAGEAIGEVKRFTQEVKEATRNVAQMEAALNRAMGVSSRAEARVLQSGIRSLSQGDLDSQTKRAGHQAQVNKMRTDGARQLLGIEREVTQTNQARMRVLERYLSGYDRLIKANQTLRRLEREGLRDSAAYTRELAAARSQIDSLVNQIPATQAADRRHTQRSLQSVVDRGPGNEEARNTRTQRYYNRLVGENATPDQIRSMVSERDSGLARQRLEQARNERATQLAAAAGLDRQRFSTMMNAQRALTTRLFQEYRQTSMREILNAADGAEARRLHDAAVENLQRRFRSEMVRLFGADVGGKAEFDRRRFDEGLDVATRSRDIRSSERGDAAYDRMRAQADADNHRFDESRRRQEERYIARRDAERAAPERSALMARKRMDAFGGAGIMSVQGSLLANYATLAAGVGSVMFLFNFAGQLEQALAKLQAISTATNGEMKDLQKTIIDLSHTSRLSAVDIAEAATVMAQAGMSASQIGKALPAVMALAIGTGTELKTVVDAITSTMTVFNLQTSEAADVANTLTAAMNLSKLDIEKYALGLQYSGNIADTVGIQYNELAAILGGMTDAGIRSGSTLGTGLRQLMLELQAPTDRAKGVFSRLGLDQSEIDVEARGIFAVLRSLKEAGFTTADATEAFEVRSVAAFKAIMNNLGGIENLNAQILGTTAALDANSIQMDTFSSKWTQFTNGAGTAFFKATEGIREMLKGVLDGLVAVMKVIGQLGPLLSVAGTLAVAFISAWAITRTASIVQGLFTMAAATTAVNGRMGLLVAHTRRFASTTATATQRMRSFNRIGALAGGWLGGLTAALSVATLVWSAFGEGSAAAQERLEASREATNRATGAMDETKETVDALDDALDRLTKRYNELSDESSPDLQAEIIQLQNRFAEYGLVLETTGENIDSLIGKTSTLRGEMAELASLQAGVALLAMEKERRDIAEVGVQENRVRLNEGLFTTGTQQTDILNMKNFLQTRGRNYAGAAESYEVLDRYQELGLGFSESEAEALDVRSVARDIAILNQTRMSIQEALEEARIQLNSSEVGTGDYSVAQADTRRLEGNLDELEKSINFVNGFYLLAQDLAQNDTRQAALRNQTQTLNAEAIVGEMGFDTVVATTLAELDSGRSKILDSAGERGAISSVDLIRELQDQLLPEFTRLERAKDDLLDEFVGRGLAADLEEAAELLERLAVGEDLQTVESLLDREAFRLTPEVNAELVDVAQMQRSAAMAEARLTLWRSRVSPEAFEALGGPDQSEAPVVGTSRTDLQFRGVQPISMHEAIAQLDRAEEVIRQSVYDEWDRSNPGMFDDGGPERFVAEHVQYLDDLSKALSDLNTIRAQVMASFDESEGGTGTQGRDARIEYLKQRRDTLLREMRTVRASVDGQSSPTDVRFNRELWENRFEEYRGIVEELGELEWDSRRWIDTEIASSLRAGHMSNIIAELNAEQTEGLEEFSELYIDILGQAAMLIARQRGQQLSEALKGTGNGTLVDDGELNRRLAYIRSLSEGAMEAYRQEFENDPNNRERLNHPEIRARFEEGLSRFIVRQAEQILEVLEKATQDRIEAAQQQVRQANLFVEAGDNRFNRYTMSDTERTMRQEAAERARLDAMPVQISALQDQESRVQQMMSSLTAEATDITPGTEAHTAWLERRNRLEQELIDIRRELTGVTEEYAAANDRASDPNRLQLITSSIEQWIFASGSLKSITEQVADNIGGLMTQFSDGMTTALSKMIRGTDDASEAWGDFMRGMWQSLLDMALKIFTNYMIIQAIKLIATMLPGGGFSQGFVDAFGAAGFGNVPLAKGKATGGLVTTGIPGRDSSLHKLMPGEFVLRQNAVDMIGVDTLRRANATGQLPAQAQLLMQQGGGEGATVNVWVVSPDQQPTMGPNDVLATVMDDIRQNGTLKKMIKSVKV